MIYRLDKSCQPAWRLILFFVIPMTSSPLGKRNPTIQDFYFPPGLPTAADLPCSDGKPVDSILQELIPGLLKATLLDIWADRFDWLFGIDLGFYYDPQKPAVSPDGMLCLGVREDPDENLRLSYTLWEEQVLPSFVLEVVSKTSGKERKEKKDLYASLGILYYLIYAPLAKRQEKFQLYKLVQGNYELQSNGRPAYWLPEIGLGIGVERFTYAQRERDWLAWFNVDGQRYPTPIDRANLEAQKSRLEAQRADQAEQEKAVVEREKAVADQRADRAEQEKAAADQRADRAEQQAAALRQKLRELGIDPDMEI
jgi:Uma2 family endonuclease